ncbi:hypothetical protein [Azospirillum doebereinerae]
MVPQGPTPRKAPPTAVVLRSDVRVALRKSLRPSCRWWRGAMV